MPNDMATSPEDRLPQARSGLSHATHCFVVMPFGRSSTERRWFRGWYQVVIAPAIRTAGYEPVLAAAEEQPAAINDEIRAHLAFDPMVVADLGGYSPDQSPNPNVMYELGIRHAFGLPVVVMAWEGQELPFDVGNQRAIAERRDILAQEANRDRLVTFISAAQQGRYYRPMDAVGRLAVMDDALRDPGTDSLLGALTREVQDLRAAFRHYAPSREARRSMTRRVKSIIHGELRRALHAAFAAAGGTSEQWAAILRSPLPDAEGIAMTQWSVDDWLEYLSVRAIQLGILQAGQVLSLPESTGTLTTRAPAGFPNDEALLAAVQRELPPQPWPKGAARAVALRLNVSLSSVNTAIATLMRRGLCKVQFAGRLYEPVDE